MKSNGKGKAVSEAEQDEEQDEERDERRDSASSKKDRNLPRSF